MKKGTSDGMEDKKKKEKRETASVNSILQMPQLIPSNNNPTLWNEQYFSSSIHAQSLYRHHLLTFVGFKLLAAGSACPRRAPRFTLQWVAGLKPLRQPDVRQPKLIKAASASKCRWWWWTLVHLFDRILPFSPAGQYSDAEKTSYWGAEILPYTRQILSL